MSRFDRVAKVLLCLLIAVESTAARVHHSHEQGDRPHAHGFGISAWLLPAAPVNDGQPWPAAPHSHLVVLGFEFYAEESPASGPPAPSPWPPDATEVASGLTAVIRDGNPLPDSTAPAVAVLPALVQPAVLAPPAPANLPRFAPRPSHCTLCDRARGERSGVCLA